MIIGRSDMPLECYFSIFKIHYHWERFIDTIVWLSYDLLRQSRRYCSGIKFVSTHQGRKLCIDKDIAAFFREGCQNRDYRQAADNCQGDRH